MKIVLEGLKIPGNIEEHISSYGELNNNNGKLSFPKDVIKSTIEVGNTPGYNYNVTITVYNPEYFTNISDIIPIPTIEDNQITDEIVEFGNDIDLTDNIKNLSKGSTVKDITENKINITKPGEYTGQVEVTFEDGSSTIVDIKVIVKEKETKPEEKEQENQKPEIVEEKLPEKDIKIVSNDKLKDKHNNLNDYLYFGRTYKEPDQPRRKQIQKVRFDIDDNKYVERKALPIRPDINTNKSEYPHYIFTIGDMTYIKVTEKGREPRKMDVKPYLKNERTMLPLRYVGEALNAGVKWDNKTRTAYFTRDGITARIQIDGNKIELSNGRVFTMDAKPDNINSRIFVPITNVSQVFTLTNGNIIDNIKQNIEWSQQDYTTTVYPNR